MYLFLNSECKITKTDSAQRAARAASSDKALKIEGIFRGATEGILRFGW